MIKVEEPELAWSVDWAADDLEDESVNTPSLWEAEIVALPDDYAMAPDEAYEDS